MLLIILFIVVFVLGIVFIYVGNEYDYFGLFMFGAIAACFSFIGLIICGCIGITLESDWEYTEAQYYNLKAQVEYIDKDDIVTSENLRNQVLNMNNKIDSHRIYHKNIWVGDFYSEKLGNLPKLEWKSK